LTEKIQGKRPGHLTKLSWIHFMAGGQQAPAKLAPDRHPPGISPVKMEKLSRMKAAGQISGRAFPRQN
jgi:hypothetical protein